MENSEIVFIYFYFFLGIFITNGIITIKELIKKDVE